MTDLTERRRMERFSLSLPCFLVARGAGDPPAAFTAETRNVSATGIYVESPTPIASDTAVDLELIIPPRMVSSSAPGSFIQTTGAVIRSEDDGMAIVFGEKYRIAPLEQLFRLIRMKMDWLDGLADPSAESGTSNVVPLFGRHSLGS